MTMVTVKTLMTIKAEEMKLVKEVKMLLTFFMWRCFPLNDSQRFKLLIVILIPGALLTPLKVATVDTTILIGLVRVGGG